MSNAALLFHPDVYETTGAQLMGRQSAGESFLRGFLRHAEVDRFYLWNVTPVPNDRAEALVNRIHPASKPISWISAVAHGEMAKPGAVFYPAPALVQESWNRLKFGPRRYSITGITHTTASSQVMDAIANMMVAPVEPWDALICTSSAVAKSLTGQLEATADYLKGRFQAARTPQIRLETIPLGINADDFATDPAQRAHWRAQLQIPDEDLVALYVGRFSIHAKMNPAPMGKALAAAAAQTGRKVHWVLSGWALPKLEEAFKQTVRDSAPGVTVHFVDGRRPDARFSIWSVADLFLSLSDNIQETYGLTPVEAMAAGLPCVISDWDGYKDTIRHGVDGFRIPTYSPGPGGGADLAYRYFNSHDTYDVYIAVASHLVAVDTVAATRALVDLIEQPDLRRRMGDAGRERARRDFDWSAIIPRYQALWTELAAIRQSGEGATPPRENPWRPDPFTYFSSYPTEALRPDMRFAAADGASAAIAAAFRGGHASNFGLWVLPTDPELEIIFAALRTHGSQTTSEILQPFPVVRRPVIGRSVLWLLKHGFVTLVNGKQTPLD